MTARSISCKGGSSLPRVGASAPPLREWHNRQHHIRGMLAIVQDGLMRNRQLTISAKIVSCIGIAVPAREIAACHIQANTVSSPEDIAGCPEVNFILVGCPRLNQRRSFSTLKVAITSTNDTICEILCITIRVNIHQARDKIGIWCARNGPYMYLDRPCHLEILF